MTELEAGSRLGRYEVQGVVGRGGMGVVYRAIQDGLERSVALKVITPALAEDLDFRARFQREAKLAASLDHPNVIPVYEAGEDGSALYLAMRFVDGEDLATVVKRTGPLASDRAIRIISQVAAALDAAHDTGLVHRDVKPHNVLLAGEHAYLTDFGLTKKTDSDATLTRTGAVLGTLDYSAPEQLRGEATDRRSDVYSLACMTYQVLAGKPPFERNSDTARMLAHLNDPPPDLPPELPAPLSAVIKQGMAKSADDRFATAGEFAQTCATALTGEAPAPAPAPASAAREPGMPRALRVGLGVALPLILIAAIVGVILASGSDDKTESAAPGVAPQPMASIPTDAFPDGIAIGDGVVWVVTEEGGTLQRIDPETNKITSTVPAGAEPDSVTADENGVVYVTSQQDDTLRRFEARPDPVPAGTVELGKDPKGVSLGLQLVWVAISGEGTVVRVDRASNDLVGGPIGVGGKPITSFVGDGRVWIPNSKDNTVSVIDVESAEPIGDATPVGKDPRDALEAFGFAWIVLAGDDAVQRLNLETHELVGDPIPVGDRPHKIAAGEGALWVTNTGDDTVTQINPDTARVAGRPLPVGLEPVNLTAGLGAVWVANTGDNTVTRIDPGTPLVDEK